VAKVLATQKHKDNVQALEGDLTKSQANVLALTAQVTGLSKDLHAARSVGLLRLPLLDFCKISFAFMLPSPFPGTEGRSRGQFKSKTNFGNFSAGPQEGIEENREAENYVLKIAGRLRMSFTGSTRRTGGRKGRGGLAD
jgi:hypothetical protein